MQDRVEQINRAEDKHGSQDLYEEIYIDFSEHPYLDLLTFINTCLSKNNIASLHMYFTNTYVEMRDFDELMNFLKHDNCPPDVKLTLAATGIGECQALVFADTLAEDEEKLKCKKLVIDLSQNDLGTKGLQAIFKVIQSGKYFKGLNLILNNIGAIVSTEDYEDAICQHEAITAFSLIEINERSRKINACLKRNELLAKYKNHELENLIRNLSIKAHCYPGEIKPFLSTLKFAAVRFIAKMPNNALNNEAIKNLPLEVLEYMNNVADITDFEKTILPLAIKC